MSTSKLRTAEERGATVVCGLAPHEGARVLYRPRVRHDPQPWLLQGSDGLRYYGRECRAVWPDKRECTHPDGRVLGLPCYVCSRETNSILADAREREAD